MSAVVVESPSDIEDGYSNNAPMVYHFGHKSPAENIELYNLLVTRLAETVNMRCENKDKCKRTRVSVNIFHYINIFVPNHTSAHTHMCVLFIISIK